MREIVALGHAINALQALPRPPSHAAHSDRQSWWEALCREHKARNHVKIGEKNVYSPPATLSHETRLHAMDMVA